MCRPRERKSWEFWCIFTCRCILFVLDSFHWGRRWWWWPAVVWLPEPVGAGRINDVCRRLFFFFFFFFSFIRYTNVTGDMKWRNTSTPFFQKKKKKTCYKRNSLAFNSSVVFVSVFTYMTFLFIFIAIVEKKRKIIISTLAPVFHWAIRAHSLIYRHFLDRFLLSWLRTERERDMLVVWGLLLGYYLMSCIIYFFFFFFPLLCLDPILRLFFFSLSLFCRWGGRGKSLGVSSARYLCVCLIYVYGVAASRPSCYSVPGFFFLFFTIMAQPRRRRRRNDNATPLTTISRPGHTASSFFRMKTEK